MSQLRIRKATVGDATNIARLVNAAYRPGDGEQGWTHESHIVSGERTNSVQVANALGKSTVLVGMHDTKIVACVQIEQDGTDAYIGMLAVDPMLQASGLGKVMLKPGGVIC